MGLFNNPFKGNTTNTTENEKIAWEQITSLEQLAQIETLSESKPVIIFKHSTTCGISKMALRSFERDYDIEDSRLAPYFLDLKAHREISNKIAERFGVQHQSPQLILIKNGSAVYNESHGNISVEEVASRL